MITSPAEGRVIDNPMTGERIVIRTSGAETAGQLLVFDLFLAPGGHVPARHTHPEQEERFTVVEGHMRFRIGQRTLEASPGETIRIPPGTPHWFGNAGAGVARILVEVRPALRMEELLERARTPTLQTRIPRLSDLAVLLLEFRHELEVPDVPAFLVHAVLAPFAWFGRRRARAHQ